MEKEDTEGGREGKTPSVSPGEEAEAPALPSQCVNRKWIQWIANLQTNSLIQDVTIQKSGLTPCLTKQPQIFSYWKALCALDNIALLILSQEKVHWRWIRGGHVEECLCVTEVFLQEAHMFTGASKSKAVCCKVLEKYRSHCLCTLGFFFSCEGNQPGIMLWMQTLIEPVISNAVSPMGSFLLRLNSLTSFVMIQLPLVCFCILIKSSM